MHAVSASNRFLRILSGWGQVRTDRTKIEIPPTHQKGPGAMISELSRSSEWLRTDGHLVIPVMHSALKEWR